MRTLIIQPIVHTPVDMGSMGEALVKQGITKLGEKEWQENQKKIAEFWNRVEEALDKLNLDWHKVRIYQDGMPVGGESAKQMVEKIAAQGSRNYQILKKLIEKGAVIEETENKGLLLKEYDYVKQLVSAPSEAEKTEALKLYEKAKDDLIKERDQFIAAQINQTLKEGERGILFIGAHHQVKDKLAKDIETKELE